LNRIWALQSLMTNYFSPQQKLISKVRDGAKVIKKMRPATTAHQRATDHAGVTAEDKIIRTDTYAELNPAANQREIQAPADTLLTITTSKAHPTTKPSVPAGRTRASANESTKPATRKS
jgi:hypothetical protein